MANVTFDSGDSVTYAIGVPPVKGVKPDGTLVEALTLTNEPLPPVAIGNETLIVANPAATVVDVCDDAATVTIFEGGTVARICGALKNAPGDPPEHPAKTAAAPNTMTAARIALTRNSLRSKHP
jgi:hypothetical protein